MGKFYILLTSSKNKVLSYNWLNLVFCCHHTEQDLVKHADHLSSGLQVIHCYWTPLQHWQVLQLYQSHISIATRQVLKLTNRASLLQHRQVLKLYQSGISIVAQAGSQTHILASPKLHSKYTQSDNLQEKRVFYTFMAKFVLLIAKCVMLMVKCAIFMVMCVWYWC